MPDDHNKNDGSDIRLRELRVLRAIVTTGTTTAAADLLGISQPAVSRALAQLEERLGRTLFSRESGRLLPTAEALGVDAELDILFKVLARIENPDRRAPDPTVPLRIAAPPTIAHRFLPGPVADFSRRFPDQRILIDVLSSDVLVTQVAEGRVDIALSDAEPNHAGVRVEPFRDSDVVCLMQRDDPLAAKTVIRPEDLHDRAYVAQTRRHSARVAKDRALAAAGVQPKITIETATVVSAAELVREGLGLALINPFPTALRLDPSLTTRAFEPRITLQTSFLSPADRRHSSATLAFMAMVRARASQTHNGEI